MDDIFNILLDDGFNNYLFIIRKRIEKKSHILMPGMLYNQDVVNNMFVFYNNRVPISRSAHIIIDKWIAQSANLTQYNLRAKYRDILIAEFIIITL